MRLVIIAMIVPASVALWILGRRMKVRRYEKHLQPDRAVGIADHEDEQHPVVSGVEADLAACEVSTEEGKDEGTVFVADFKGEPAAVLVAENSDFVSEELSNSPSNRADLFVPLRDHRDEITAVSNNAPMPANPACSEFESSIEPLLEDEQIKIKSGTFDNHAIPLSNSYAVWVASVANVTLQDNAVEQISSENGAAETATESATYETDRIDVIDGPMERPEPEEVDDLQEERVPKRYRPPTTRRSFGKGDARTSNQEISHAKRSEVRLEIRLRLTFDRFGFCVVGLLPERLPDLDNEIIVRSGGVSYELLAQEDWYQDIPIGIFAGHLREGLELRGRLADRRYARWLLTGRDVFVLASHPRASGFVSTSRIALGRSHVILCAAEWIDRVERVLVDANCEGYTKLDESYGIPSGWVGIRNVVPRRALPLELGNDTFYALKPAPDIDIQLEGGVRLHHSVWLAGYPPRVKLYGPPAASVKIVVDGKVVEPSADGSLMVDGFDLPGHHFVSCEGLSCSRTYSIEESPESWDAWPAHNFGNVAICGPLVQMPFGTSDKQVFTGPMSNPLLLGAEPGQVFRCSYRNVPNWKGLVPFEVVWALPAQPLLCDKRSARILQFSETAAIRVKGPWKLQSDWCIAILDASRKGLQVEGGSPNAKAQWNGFKKIARNIRRAKR